MKIKHLMFLLSFIFIGFTSCKNNEEGEVELEDPEVQEEVFEENVDALRERNLIVDDIEARPELSTFATSLNAWNVEEKLADLDGNFIIFAPNNTAYSDIYREQGYDVLQVNPDEVLPYQIVKMDLNPDQLRQRIQAANGKLLLPTMEGEEIEASLNGNTIILTGATGDTATVIDNFSVNNGTVYVVDSVLLPEGIQTEVEVTE